MIKFILGEDRHIKYAVISPEQSAFKIQEATWRLIRDETEEASGQCQIIHDEKTGESWVDAKLQPEYKSKLYELEITLKIADETIMNRECMEVV